MRALCTLTVVQQQRRVRFAPQRARAAGARAPSARGRPSACCSCRRQSSGQHAEAALRASATHRPRSCGGSIASPARRGASVLAVGRCAGGVRVSRYPASTQFSCRTFGLLGAKRSSGGTPLSVRVVHASVMRCSAAEARSARRQLSRRVMRACGVAHPGAHGRSPAGRTPEGAASANSDAADGSRTPSALPWPAVARCCGASSSPLLLP
jgi:hypothetical protein